MRSLPLEVYNIYSHILGSRSSDAMTEENKQTRTRLLCCALELGLHILCLFDAVQHVL